eukprot:3932687-Rhodomonas_salina.1
MPLAPNRKCASRQACVFLQKRPRKRVSKTIGHPSQKGSGIKIGSFLLVTILSAEDKQAAPASLSFYKTDLKIPHYAQNDAILSKAIEAGWGAAAAFWKLADLESMGSITYHHIHPCSIIATPKSRLSCRTADSGPCLGAWFVSTHQQTPKAAKRAIPAPT